MDCLMPRYLPRITLASAVLQNSNHKHRLIIHLWSIKEWMDGLKFSKRFQWEMKKINCIMRNKRNTIRCFRLELKQWRWMKITIEGTNNRSWTNILIIIARKTKWTRTLVKTWITHITWLNLWIKCTYKDPWNKMECKRATWVTWWWCSSWIILTLSNNNSWITNATTLFSSSTSNSLSTIKTLIPQWMTRICMQSKMSRVISKCLILITWLKKNKRVSETLTRLINQSLKTIREFLSHWINLSMIDKTPLKVTKA